MVTIPDGPPLSAADVKAPSGSEWLEAIKAANDKGFLRGLAVGERRGQERGYLLGLRMERQREAHMSWVHSTAIAVAVGFMVGLVAGGRD